MKKIAIASALVPLALLAACGTARDDSGATTSPIITSAPPSSTGTESPATPSPAPSSATALPGTPSATGGPRTSGAPSTGASELAPPTGTKPVEVSHTPARPPLVTGVRFARHEGYDRVVLDLTGAMAGYSVDWVKQLVEDGSGDPIAIKGGAYLAVTLRPAEAHTKDGKPTLGGNRVLPAGLGNVRSVVRTGDFEGTVSLALVLGHQAGFRVIEQSAPSRLVVDVAH
ncbi:AMIN-like domain-containing (lipo)protein [Sphaerisporangium fuscum]|uniref:AMIN-like domain-containing (lipo)protein n=1 Tax=Sphaerisporangium fuscum TaxID=2835868 RepID=UPI001BDD0FD3|nr:hypothetical protein [Sphaerisporangium fuscum]